MVNQDKAKYYCCEDISLIENYDEAIKSSEKWECHHKLGLNKSKQELIDMDLYYERPASELIFIKQSEHRALHNSILKSGNIHWNKGKIGIYSEETKKSMGVKKGNVPWNKDKHLGEEIKTKISESHKGLTSPTKGKKYNRYKCLTSDGQIKIMPINVIHRYHWEIIKED